jgi:hypothetical protein
MSKNIASEKDTRTSNLTLSDGTACIVLGGSSMALLATSGDVEKVSFYPKNLQEYLDGIVDSAIHSGKLKKNEAGVLVVAAPGAFHNEGTLVGLTDNFHRVRDDAIQRGMPNIFFRDLVEAELAKKGYNKTKVYGYNDTVPAISATLGQPNTEEVLQTFERELYSKERDIKDRSQYVIKYMINGTGTGDASMFPDTGKVLTCEKGHLKPDFLWYQINPFFKYVTRLQVVGQNRTIERLIAGGPNNREARHFTRILNTVLNVLNNPQDPEANDIAKVLGFQNYDEMLRADGPNGILTTKINTEGASSLQQIGEAILKGSGLALNIRDIFARALGSAMAFMHFAIGEMPDVPLNTFISPADVRYSALGFIRSDGSTTALLGTEGRGWEILEKAAQEYAHAIVGNKPHLFKVLNINTTFPNIHPDFGGLPHLAKTKLDKLKAGV